MLYYNDEDRKLHEDGLELVARMNEDYRELVEEDEDAYISDAMEGWVHSFWQMAAVLRATGLMEQAYESVIDEVELAVRDNLVVR